MERRKKITKIILITITLLFLLLMLAAPLLSVLVSDGDCGCCKYLFWKLCVMALDEVFVPGQTDFSYTD